MNVLSNLESLFAFKKIGKIVEIGIGYGGQTLIIDQYFPKIEFTLLDLAPVLELSKKYLNSFNLNGSFINKTLNEHDYNTQYDLVISNYAFSELPKETQILYLNKILTKSSRGFLVMNSGSPLQKNINENQLNYIDIKKYIPLAEFLPEIPKTSESNYILIWGRDKKN